MTLTEAEYPAHASPNLPPLVSPPTEHPSFNLLHDQHANDPPIVTPRFTPPHTPTPQTPPVSQSASLPPSSTPTQPHDLSTVSSDAAPPLPPLPEVWCEVRARIPTTAGQEMFLHLYHNSVDNKEHLAIVFGPHIRSKTLDAAREGETERDRMIRGAYIGRLWPGRTSSRIVNGSGAKGKGKGKGKGNGEVTGGPGTDGGQTNGRGAEERGDVQDEAVSRLAAPLVRIHSECYTGETVWSARCDCGEQLDEAARLMSDLPTDPDVHVHAVSPARNGTASPNLDAAEPPSLGGVIIYLRQEGRGIGLLSKLKAYNLQDLGADTLQANILLRHPADARSYGLATAMLLDLGLGGERGIRLLTNNPDKVRAVEGPGREVRVRERVPMIPLAWKSGGKEGVRGEDVEKYISTKIEKFKHMFSQ